MMAAQGHTSRGTAERAEAAAARVTLLNEFGLEVAGEAVSAPHAVQRLIALLSLTAHPLARSRVAGLLWPEAPEWRALGNLRSVLWRLRRVPPRLVVVLDDRIGLEPSVRVDFHDIAGLARALAHAPEPWSLERLPELVAAAELLPGWEDDWIAVERSRFHELRIHALERACEAVLQRGEHSAAVQAAMAAIDAEPYRDSTQRLLLKAYLSEGNVAAAMRSYYGYRDLLRSELGIEPSDSMRALVAAFDRRRRRRPGT
jgi:DNA-binding SARP family transcriptional activator